MELEQVTYSKVIRKNINNYLAIAPSGKIKRKGLFKLRLNEKGEDEIPLGDSVNETVVAQALNNYFIKDIPIEETIQNPDKYGIHIYEYCCSNKISKDYEVWWNKEKVQNLNRYYFSRSAPFLLKRKKDTAKKRKKNASFEHVNVDDPVILFNEYQEKPWSEYKINYNHYIAKTREVINELQISKKQLSLF